MNRLLEQADPAKTVEVDRERLRALVDDRLGLEPIARPRPGPSVRPWVAVGVAFVIVMAIAVPALLNRNGPSEMATGNRFTWLPGVSADVTLASGGVQTMAIEGDDIWVVTALQHLLQRVSLASNEIEETFDIDGYVEGVIAGDGYLWLLSYDNGGEVLRFDPSHGSTDLRIPLGGSPGFAHWHGGRLFVGNDQGMTLEISAAGEVLSRRPWILRGEGLGLLWVLDPSDGSIRSLSADGTLGTYVIPASTPEFGDLGEVRRVREAGGYLWLIFGEAGESVGRFDPTTGELQPLHVGRWLHGSTEHDGALWMTSYTDHLLFRVDPQSGDVQRYALPGRPGGVESVDGELAVLLYQPGSLLWIDPAEDLLAMGPEVAAFTSDVAAGGSHTLVCTLSGADAQTLERVQVQGDFSGLEPTVVLEGPSWLGGGTWSVVQAQIEGRVVCASGHVGEGGTPEQRATDLERALTSAGVPGPYELVAAGDGVHTVRLFAEGRDDVRGMVLVEPIPIGFQDFYDEVLGEEFGHPGWLDLERAVSASLADLGEMPLVIVSHEPDAVFLADRFVDSAGEERARSVSEYWEDGLDFYATLAPGSRRVSVPDAGFEGVIWFRPEIVVDAIVETVPVDE